MIFFGTKTVKSFFKRDNRPFPGRGKSPEKTKRAVSRFGKTPPLGNKDSNRKEPHNQDWKLTLSLSIEDL
jgi:hypothetical protein